MSQLTVGTSALHLLPQSSPDEASIFERLPMTPAPSFEAPRLRLAVQKHVEGGRRGAAVAGAPRRLPRQAPVRLTRRGRVVVVLLLALVATLALFVLGLVPSQASTGVVPAAAPGGAGVAGVAAAGGAGAAPSGSSVIAQPGDSLWSIAARVAPRTDPRVEVQHLIDRNHLGGTSIEAGQVLVLP